MNTTPTYIVRQWHTPQRCAGQIVEYAYGLDVERQIIIVRRCDRSDGSIMLTSFAVPDDWADAEWPPLVEAPPLGRNMGPCSVAAA
jgi:hypothetical protein